MLVTDKSWYEIPHGRLVIKMLGMALVTTTLLALLYFVFMLFGVSKPFENEFYKGLILIFGSAAVAAIPHFLMDFIEEQKL